MGLEVESVSVKIMSRRVWTVEGKGLDESQSWSFDHREDAVWFRDVAREYWNAQCPKCGMENMLGLDVSGEHLYGWTVLVSCGYHTCSFAKRIVSFGDPARAVGNPSGGRSTNGFDQVSKRR